MSPKGIAKSGEIQRNRNLQAGKNVQVGSMHLQFDDDATEEKMKKIPKEKESPL